MARQVDPFTQLLSLLQTGKTEEFCAFLINLSQTTALELCSRESKQNGTLVHIAASLGDTEALRAMLSLGADVNKKQTEGHVISGLAPLHCAVKGRHLLAVQYLLEHGANVNVQEAEGQTPLCCACMAKSADLVTLLLDVGADVNMPDYKGQTPLQTSIIRAPQEVTKILIQRGADVNVLDKDGQSPLHYASEWGDVDIVQLLISRGCNVNLQDNDGRSALHLTADQELLDILVESGGNVNLRDRHGKPPVETQIDVEKDEYKKINAALSVHVDLMAKRKQQPVAPSPLAKDIQQKYNKLAMSGSTEGSAAKVNMLAELQSRVQQVEIEEAQGAKPKYRPSPLAGAGVLTELKCKTSRLTGEEETN